MPSLQVLIIDDEPAIRQILSKVAADAGHTVMTAANGEDALARLGKGDIDVALCDIRMPDITGIDVVGKARLQGIDTIFLMMTAYASVNTAIEAMRAGAYDYMIKPLRSEDLVNRLEQLADVIHLKSENRVLRELVKSQSSEPGAMASPAMRVVERLTIKVAPTSSTVLITGASGSGKGVIAQNIHQNSQRSNHSFIPVNCGAIPENLIESALFGHERGAFTGAHARQIGFFERANGGTLFLDEVDSLSPEAQVRLLRVLQEGEYERVGGRQLLRNGARIVAATNTQPQKAIETGRLRSDLYYRLNVVNIHIPPLRERPEDLPVLIDHILSKLNQCYGHRVTSLGERAKRSLMHYHWPGNVRQLENVLERSYIFAAGSRLDTVLFDEDHLQVSSTANVAAATPQPSKETAPWKHRGKAALRAQERQALEVALARHGGNVTQAATAMGYSRRAIYLKLRAHGIDPKSYRS